MRVEVSITGIEELRASLKDFSERRLNAAVATAMTRTAVKLRNALQENMQQVFDRPTPYTVRQLRYVAATAQRPVAAVGFNIAPIQDVFGNVVRYEDLGTGSTPAGKYLQFQTEGGQRRNKRFEKALRQVGVLPAGWYAVPGQRAKVDAYGNQSLGEIRQILSWFDAAELVAGSRQNMYQKGRDKRIKGTKRTAGFEFFVSLPGANRTFARAGGGSGTHAMQPGIYRRTKLALGTRIEPVVMFVPRMAYKKRFDFYGIAERITDETLRPELDRAIAESAARLAGRVA